MWSLELRGSVANNLSIFEVAGVKFVYTLPTLWDGTPQGMLLSLSLVV